MTLIAVIDHGAGNLVSITRGLELAGATVALATAPADLEGADGVVLPGVGHAGAAMDRIVAAGFQDSLRGTEVPLLGVCVGMQLLFEASEETDVPLLGILEGRVQQLGATRLPHMGWNDVSHRGDPLFSGVPSATVFYFVHSYAPPVGNPAVIACADHEGHFGAAVRRGIVSGVQFHPERSGPDGLRVLGNFVTECQEARHAA